MTTSARKMFRSHSGTEMLKSENFPQTSSQTMSGERCSVKNVADIYDGSLSEINLEERDTTPLLSECSVGSSISIPPPLPRHQVESAEIDLITNSFTPVGDRKRTLMRYVAAVEELKAALRLGRPGWEKFEFPEFDIIPESDGSLALLQEAIDEKLNASDEFGDRSIWQKGKKMAERLFVALSPFAKNFLTVAKGASQSVLTMS
jgi:hypothetical protein